MRRLVLTIVVLATAWSLASFGYFWSVPLLDAEIGYNDAPWFFAFYYGLWSLAVFLVFRSTFGKWAGSFQPGTYAPLIALMILVFGGYALFVLPRLPMTEWPFDGYSPVEFFWATSWYFLPKSLEILFQQLILAALVLALDALKLTLKQISITLALLFGGFHLTLALSNDNPVYVLRYSFAATLFGLVVPWLILRVKGGFLISYAIHWTFYAIDIALIHFVFAAE